MKIILNNIQITVLKSAYTKGKATDIIAKTKNGNIERGSILGKKVLKIIQERK